jgi:16S rRNA C1402 (ribose-2'-O) methylase RsmI
VGPNNEDYDITPWNFIWAMDNEGRIFQFLIQKEKNEFKDSQATLVALAPPELGKLFNQYKEGAILRTLSLLNNPKKMRFLIVLAPKGKSIAEEQQLIQVDKKTLEKFKHINKLKQMPNIKGQWFYESSPRCPNCNKLITEIKGFNVGFAKLKCPYCGYQKS